MLRATDLNPGERLFVERIRARESQAEAAERHGVSTYRFTGWENGTREDAPSVRTGRLAEREVFALLRRRAGLGVAEAAELVGCSPHWIGEMEKPAGVSLRRYRDFWGQYDGLTTGQAVARVTTAARDLRRRRSTLP